MIDYHDNEWSPDSVLDNDRYLFEMLTLSGAQAGLSWSIILNRRESYRKAYDSWSIEMIAEFSKSKVEELISSDSGIVRNRRKIEASVCNASSFRSLCEKGSFLSYLLQWFPEGVLVYDDEPPVRSAISEAVSKDLISRGFKFVGPVIVQAFLLSVGLMRGHDRNCHLHHKRKRNGAPG